MAQTGWLAPMMRVIGSNWFKVVHWHVQYSIGMKCFTLAVLWKQAAGMNLATHIYICIYINTY